jgi:hypothetical protein
VGMNGGDRPDSTKIERGRVTNAGTRGQGTLRRVDEIP